MSNIDEEENELSTVTEIKTGRSNKLATSFLDLENKTVSNHSVLAAAPPLNY